MLQHLVVIPDGDRRWAKEKGLPPWEGHRKGAENITGILEVCKELNIPYLSMWGFSTENWNRDKEEVTQLMKLFGDFLQSKRKEFIAQEIQFRHIGRKDRLSPELLAGLEKLEKDTAHFDKWHYTVGLDYGGQDEVIRAAKKLATAYKNETVSLDDITPETFSTYLDTAVMPPPDFIIRTSGEQRTSGFMVYQAAYAEFCFLPMYFPDLTKEKLKEIIEQFQERERRFGK